MANITNNPLGALAAVNALSQPAEKYVNDHSVEAMWAMKAYEHAEIYFNLICSVDPSRLRLCPHDNEIHEKFREMFPTFNVKFIDEKEIKSPAAKKKWREFCNAFENVIQDFNFGSLVRIDCSKGYTEENSIFAMRAQFLAVEISRNKEGHNQIVFNKAEEMDEKENSCTDKSGSDR